MHSKECLAAALIATVENFRDEDGMTDLDFRLVAQDHTFLTVADEYLADGTKECVCGYRRAHAFANDLRAEAERAWARGDHWHAEQLVNRAAHAEADRTVE